MMRRCPPIACLGAATTPLPILTAADAIIKLATPAYSQHSQGTDLQGHNVIPPPSGI